MKLQIGHIRKGYDGRTVLRDCSYAFDGRSVHVLMGPNGCGKSTLLRIFSLLERPDGGQLLYSDNGATLDPDMRLRRRMTLVLPHTGVFNTTVFNNAAYGLKVRGARKDAIAPRVQEVLAFVGLSHKLKQNALTLSSGETQRLGIARALGSATRRPLALLGSRGYLEIAVTGGSAQRYFGAGMGDAVEVGPDG